MNTVMEKKKKKQNEKKAKQNRDVKKIPKKFE